MIGRMTKDKKKQKQRGGRKGNDDIKTGKVSKQDKGNSKLTNAVKNVLEEGGKDFENEHQLQNDLNDCSSSGSGSESDIDESDMDQGEFVAVESNRNRKKRTLSGSSSCSEEFNHEKDRKMKYIGANDQFVFITGFDVNVTKLNPSKVMKEIENVVEKPKSMQIRGDSLRVLVPGADAKLLRSSLKEILNHRVKIEIQEARVQYLRGVISGVQLDIEESEIVDACEEHEVLKVERMKKFNPNSKTREPLKTVVLFFKGNTLPDFVSIGFRRYPVREYRQGPVRCYKCQKYGHTYTNCKQEHETCSNCGGKHNFRECQASAPKCIQCGGDHAVIDKECPMFKRAKNIQELVTDKKLTYAQAAKLNENPDLPVPNKESNNVDYASVAGAAGTTKNVKNVQERILVLPAAEEVTTSQSDQSDSRSVYRLVGLPISPALPALLFFLTKMAKDEDYGSWSFKEQIIFWKRLCCEMYGLECKLEKVVECVHILHDIDVKC